VKKRRFGIQMRNWGKAEALPRNVSAIMKKKK
jgi:hypothetical protein